MRRLATRRGAAAVGVTATVRRSHLAMRLPVGAAAQRGVDFVPVAAAAAAAAVAVREVGGLCSGPAAAARRCAATTTTAGATSTSVAAAAAPAPGGTGTDESVEELIPCWNCGAPHAGPRGSDGDEGAAGAGAEVDALGAFVCASCDRVQPARPWRRRRAAGASVVAPAPSWFALFGLRPRMALDAQVLRSRFRTRQRRLHPDKFSAAEGAAATVEAEHAAAQSAALNRGMTVLLAPHLRAVHLLALRGIVLPGADDDDEDEGEPIEAPEVDMELLMEVFQTREELETASKEEALEVARRNHTQTRQIEAAFERALEVEADLEAAKDLAVQLQYRKRIADACVEVMGRTLTASDVGE